ncbi:MAG: DegT/DnrJ/EryC1/StrS family aminotransferase [Hungatella sp.]|nr:DegT/DnrJ/EryC1/StrS family aminotransferase [Hungatella sp.]MCI8951527.1 DegT/DnrJ/EryC1/StrS family aminotransferase [Lachnospiraceae bacterium]
MKFRDLGKQYQAMKADIDVSISTVIEKADFIHGEQVGKLEKCLAEYVGVRHCISCANGTDALQLALMAWGIGKGDAVFVPDFTFFASGEVVSAVGAVPIFVDVNPNTFNLSDSALEMVVEKVEKEGKLRPAVVLAVDLFGQPAEHGKIREIAEKHGMLVLEDGAQGFGGRIGERKACSFGDISTTSFFPAKPLGCYGDGGAIFTDNDHWMELIRSYCVHGKGTSKYDNVRIGMNSRLDTLQASVLLGKYPHFVGWELEQVQTVAQWYDELLRGIVEIPCVLEGYYSSWAQYTVKFPDKEIRDGAMRMFAENKIPCAVYYEKPMHRQRAFLDISYEEVDYPVSTKLSQTVLSLPFHPYMSREEVNLVGRLISEYAKEWL